MFLLVPANPVCSRQNPDSRKMAVCVCSHFGTFSSLNSMSLLRDINFAANHITHRKKDMPLIKNGKLAHEQTH